MWIWILTDPHNGRPHGPGSGSRLLKIAKVVVSLQDLFITNITQQIDYSVKQRLYFPRCEIIFSQKMYAAWTFFQFQKGIGVAIVRKLRAVLVEPTSDTVALWGWEKHGRAARGHAAPLFSLILAPGPAPFLYRRFCHYNSSNIRNMSQWRLKERGGISGLGGLMFEISSKVQQIWYNCSSRF